MMSQLGLQVGVKFKKEELPGPSPWPPLQVQVIHQDDSPPPQPLPCDGCSPRAPGDKDVGPGRLLGE